MLKDEIEAEFCGDGLSLNYQMFAIENIYTARRT
jgi:hypothetical protein